MTKFEAALVFGSDDNVVIELPDVDDYREPSEGDALYVLYSLSDTPDIKLLIRVLNGYKQTLIALNRVFGKMNGNMGYTGPSLYTGFEEEDYMYLYEKDTKDLSDWIKGMYVTLSARIDEITKKYPPSDYQNIVYTYERKHGVMKIDSKEELQLDGMSSDGLINVSRMFMRKMREGKPL
jgi:hypothetical protein